MKEEQARNLIRFYMRQMDGGYYPLQISDQPALLELVDSVTAQRIYEEEIAALEMRCGPLPRWDSEKNSPVAGTPKP